MSDQKILDIAHISFLDMIKSIIDQTGAAAAKGSLIRNALGAAEKFEAKDFATFEEFVDSIEAIANAITSIEGQAVHVGNGLFGLPNCPFAASIKNYKDVFKAMPEGYGDLTEEFNKTGGMTEKLNVGHGAGVSPFCAVHQPLRSGLGKSITIGGKPIQVLQLGCKSGVGEKGLADKMIQDSDYSADDVSKVLDDNMCCYAVKVGA